MRIWRRRDTSHYTSRLAGGDESIAVNCNLAFVATQSTSAKHMLAHCQLSHVPTYLRIWRQQLQQACRDLQVLQRTIKQLRMAYQPG
jgi:hypothetical protein